LTRRLLALVLALALVWHTAVVPAYVPARVRGSGAPPPDADERDAEAPREREFAPAFAGSSLGRMPRGDERPDAGVDDLEWPEIIGGD
jgi:hypothetical protein